MTNQNFVTPPLIYNIVTFSSAIVNIILFLFVQHKVKEEKKNNIIAIFWLPTSHFLESGEMFQKKYFL